MTAEAVRDGLAIATTGSVLLSGVAGLAWRFVVKPQLQLHILNPLQEIQKELHPNGGSSLRDRVDAAVSTGASNGELIAGHIEEAQSDHRLLLRMQGRLDEHLRQQGSDRP